MTKKLTHYWGSYFKSDRHAENMRLEFEVLTNRGWDCHLVLERLPDDQRWIDGFRKLGVGVSCLPRPRKSFDFAHVFKIWRLCRETRCNVFRCDNMHMSPLIGAFLAGIPGRVWCKHSMNSHYEQCREPGLRERVALTTRLSTWLSTKVIAVSSAVASEVRPFTKSPDKVLVLNNPRPEIKSSASTKEDSRRKLGIPEDAVVFVSVARAEKVKGWDILLKAFAHARSKSPRAYLLLVGAKDVGGDTRFMNELEELVAQLDLSAKVCFAGHVSDVRSTLKAGDVFVLPSRSEGCCLALLEALELSLPCIATQVGNAAEVIANEVNGLLIARDNIDALTRALQVMLTNDNDRAGMAANSKIPEHVPRRLEHAGIIADMYASQLVSRTTGSPAGLPA